MAVTIFIMAALCIMGLGFGRGFHDAALVIGFMFGISFISGVIKEIIDKWKE